MRTPTYCLAAFLFTLLPPAILADTLTFSSGRSISGTVLQTNGDNLLLLTDYATFRFSRSGLKAIEIAQTPFPVVPRIIVQSDCEYQYEGREPKSNLIANKSLGYPRNCPTPFWRMRA